MRVGDGENHRFHLGDMILIKENHIRARGGFGRLVERLNTAPPAGLPIEVEVDSIEQFRDLFGTPVDRIMLDNFSAAKARSAVKALKAYQKQDPGFKPSIELSGGVTLANIHDYLIPGIDFISIGALTHSSPALDVSLEVIQDAS